MQTHMPECSIIIPVYNKWELTRACLASICEYSRDHCLEVVVVDNGSSDATASELIPYGTALFGDRFNAIVFPENRNFGPACNAGARAATSPVLFFLNNDTLMTPGWLSPLLEAIRAENTPGAIGPLLLYEDGSVQHMGVAYGTRGPLHLYQHFPADHPVVTQKRELQAITGAALMIQADFFRDCGEFYEEYRNGFEDLDLCVQIRQRGGTLRCIPTSRVYHLESQTPGRMDDDGHNGSVFTRRCAKNVYTDIHHHALRDGFDIFISDLLTANIKLKEKDEATLTAQAQNQDIALWLKIVHAHPLWIHGREFLAHMLEQTGQYDEAAGLRADLAKIEPVIPRYKDLLRFVPRVASAPWQARALRQMDIMMRHKTDQPLARSVVLETRSRFRPGGEPFLEKLFAKKLEEWFPAEGR